MSHEPGTVGVIGVGTMGSAMAANLVAAGFRVLVDDVSRPAIERAGRAGCEPAAVSAMCRECETLVTSLPSVSALSEVVAAISASGGGPKHLIETSTFPLSDKEKALAELQAVGVAMLDCPLSGTGRQAIAKDIVAYASGDEAVWLDCRGVLAGFARSAPYLGPFGSGTRMKLIANLLVGIHTAAAGEAFALARKAGLDPNVTLEVITSSAGSSRSLEARGDMLAANTYDTIRTMPLNLWRKDLAVIAAFAAELGCPTPLFAAATPLFNAAVAQGLGDQDTAAVAIVSNRLAGLPDS